MSIRQLPSGRFQARLTIDGRQFGESFDTRQQAEDWELVLRARAVNGALPSRVTVAHYAARWLDTYRNAPANTRAFYEQHLGPLLEVLGRMEVAKVTPTDITRTINRITDEGGVAKADRCYRTLSALFGAAYGDSIIDRNPVRGRKHRPRRQARPPVVLERQQARLMLLQLGGWQRDAAGLQLMFGARYGEIAGLSPHDVDLAAGRIHIVRRYSEQAGTVRATKNHRRRTLEIPDAARATLQRLVELAGAVEPIPDLADREHDARQYDRLWLVQTATGRPPNLSMLNRALRQACLAVDAPAVTSHGLRHTYVSWMIDAGHSADKIAFWIGDTPDTVRRVYAHMLEASSKPAAAEIDAALGDLG